MDTHTHTIQSLNYLPKIKVLVVLHTDKEVTVI